MIKVYHARRARSVRVIWLLEELGVPYEVETVELTSAALQSPQYLRLHPLGKVPFVKDGAVGFFESGAIVEYLLETYGGGRLAPLVGTPLRAEYFQWFHFAEASLAAHVSEIVGQRFGQPSDGPPGQNATVLSLARGRLSRSLAVVDRTLEDRPFICGETFSAADIMVSYGITMARITRELDAKFVNVAAYLGRLKERPAYARAWA